ncbi:glycosyltransferase family 4 protein [Salinibacter ruber]|uniref:glycosyltransferase family 4 protein n=1 Tax=Salinibacter ruber TaxID=146919 RepID=UPI002169D436|nr:glycosyltransferase family 4 protein [Salinibacter ruber]MCS4149339.1 glycosyltransferase involved in cell wall biosynthesis [Salinibacter ruber]
MRDVAVVSHDVRGKGGVASMRRFLSEALQASENYRPHLVSLALSSTDETSVRILSPSSWREGVQVHHRSNGEMETLHVGAWGVEVEPFRYQPRAALDNVLSEFDLIQFVTGTPPWAYTARNVDRPTFLWTATTLMADREARLETQNGPRGWWRWAMSRRAQAYERDALAQVDEVFALSNYTRDNLRSQFSVDATVATQGVDAERFRPVDEPSADYFLTVSRINDPRKRIPLLLRAYAGVKEKSPDAPDLYLVGEEPNQKIRGKTRELGIADSVEFLGRRSSSELVDLYQHALCFVLSSAEEGLGIVILEAMVCGCPVVSTRCGGPETLVVDDETGILTPVGDVGALRREMLRLVENESLRREMGAASRRRVEEAFAKEVAKEPFLDVYEKY